jgi:hypothetical protein
MENTMDPKLKEIIVGLIDATKELTKVVQGLNQRVDVLEQLAAPQLIRERILKPSGIPLF